MAKMPKVLVSACLAGRDCRYDGQNSATQLPNGMEKVLYCPEVGGGLPIPREPAEIVGGSGDDVLVGQAYVVTRSGNDVTKQYVQGAKEALSLCQQQGISMAILKKRSPSCGASQIYDGTYTGTLRPGAGVTAALLIANGIKVEEM